jgi:hypothetical protein
MARRMERSSVLTDSLKCGLRNADDLRGEFDVKSFDKSYFFSGNGYSFLVTC